MAKYVAYLAALRYKKHVIRAEKLDEPWRYLTKSYGMFGTGNHKKR